MPFLNVDTYQSLKAHYAQKEIIFGLKGYNSSNTKEWNYRELDFKDLSKVINSNFKGYKYDVPYKSIEFDFVNLSNDLIYNQLCVIAQDLNKEKIIIPVFYLVGNTNFYDIRKNGTYCFLNNFFYSKEEFLQKTFNQFKCEDIVQKYSGKKVYYGLDKTYNYKSKNSDKFNALENRILTTKELYVLKKGTYDCVGFDVFKRYDDDYKYSKAPFAILKDSLGVEFRVPVCKTTFRNYYPEIYCEKFEDYFVLDELVDSIVKYRAEIKLQKEIAKQEKIHSLTKKYGKVYAIFLMDYSDETILRFEVLSKKYGKANAKLIIEGIVRLGWSKEMCKESWGNPNDINTTRGSWGVHEQWVYEFSYEDYYNMRCLYFENGVLTTIQD